MRNLTILSAAAVAAAFAGTALAQDQEALQAAIDARQAQMTLHAANLGVLNAMAGGDVAYDAENAAAAAGNLAALASIDHRFYWPEGSSSAEMEGTRALPEIWENFDAFAGRLGAFVEATAGLTEAAGAGQESLQAAVAEVGGTCGACHGDFRE